MNFNILTYSLFLAINTLIIIKIGHICHKNGKIFIRAILSENNKLTSEISKLLLMGYYLINIGYVVFITHNWKPLHAIIQIVESIATKTSIILFILAFLHYFNIFWISHYIKNFK